ncbi:hypothetical protein IWW48_000548 [Coemansia sp. RSA 1200]|nr:hypothetical protein IWW48_000548 [Coemansia sp. RSA 1200]
MVSLAPKEHPMMMMRKRQTVAVAGCPAGYTNCATFGCIQGTECPATCSERRDAASCAVSVNGIGCKWMYNTCVQDIQCSVDPTGTCSEGCRGCGEFQCIIQGLTCPTPCAVRPMSKCNTVPFYNGLACAWIGNTCVTWNAIRNSPVAATALQPTEGQLSTTTVTVEVLHTIDNDYPTDDLITDTPPSSATPTPSSSANDNDNILLSSESSSSEYEEEVSSSAEEESSSSEEPSEDTAESEISTDDTTALPEEEESSSSELPLYDEAASENSNSNNSHTGTTQTKKTNTITIVVIIIAAFCLIGLVSWAGLYMFTKNKSSNTYSSSARMYAKPGTADMAADKQRLPLFNYNYRHVDSK